MSWLFALLSWLAFAVAMCAPYQTGGVVRVLCDGDSTTLGTGGSVNGAYRRFLAAIFWLDTWTAVRIDFVGGTGDASFANAAHWGHAGTTIEDHDTGGSEDVAPYLDPADARLRPDIVIRQLGVNNIGAGDTPAQAAAKLVTLMLRDHGIRPDLIWILCTITPHESGVTNALHVAFNLEITKQGGVRDQCIAAGMDVRIADCHAAINPATQITSGAHPNDSGYQSEAENAQLDPLTEAANDVLAARAA